jgi:hypothetical protein
VRAALSAYLDERGFEVLRSDASHSFGVNVSKHSHDACLDEVDNADFLLLIIGGRHGGTYVASEKSITNEEYNRAKRRFIPIFVFVVDSVNQAAKVYAKNPTANLTEFVDDIRVFAYLEKIRAQERGNWLFEFGDVEGIKRTMTTQLAHLALLYSRSQVAQYGTKPADDKEPLPVAPLTTDFSVITQQVSDDDDAAYQINGLRTVYNCIQQICLKAASGKEDKLKTLWLFGKYGETPYGGPLTIEEPRFKQFAWGVTRGRKVFTQLKDFGVNAGYDFEHAEEEGSGRVYLSFTGEHEDEASWALRDYVRILEQSYDDNALALFMRGDMSVYTAEEQLGVKVKSESKQESGSIQK